MASQSGSESDPIERRVFPTTPRLTEPIKVPRIDLRVDSEGGKPSTRTVTFEGDLLRLGSHPSNELVLDDSFKKKVPSPTRLAVRNAFADAMNHCDRPIAAGLLFVRHGAPLLELLK